MNFITPELREARARLYRRRLLRVNYRWKVLGEIYEIYIPLHRSELNILDKNIPSCATIQKGFLKNKNPGFSIFNLNIYGIFEICGILCSILINAAIFMKLKNVLRFVEWFSKFCELIFLELLVINFRNRLNY